MLPPREEKVTPFGFMVPPQEFGRRYGAGLHLLLAFGAAFVVDADRGFQFLLAFFFAAHVKQHLASDVMNVGAEGIEFAGGVNGGERVLIFFCR